MKVSVIIPVYNVESYIRECLDSIINQTIGRKIEIIIVNDGSPDNSQEIIDEYASKDSRIVSIVQKNKGLSGARNTGLKYAKGKYVYFMDSDDYLELNALEKLYNLAEMENLDIICFEANSFFDRSYSGKLKKDSFNYKKNGTYTGVYKGIEIYNQLIKNEDFYASVCLKFFKRSFLKKHNITFKEGIIHEDECFSLFSIVKSDRVEILDNTFFNRRIRNDSIMTQKNYEKSFIGYSYTALQSYELFMQLDYYGKSMIRSGCNNIFVAALESYIFIPQKNEDLIKKYNVLKKMVFSNKNFATRKTKIKYLMPFFVKVRRILIGKML